MRDFTLRVKHARRIRVREGTQVGHDAREHENVMSFAVGISIANTCRY